MAITSQQAQQEVQCMDTKCPIADRTMERPSPTTEHSRPVNTSYKSLGESDILEIPGQNSAKKIELAMNSVLTFTNKCISDKITSEKIKKMLTGFYDEKDLKQAYEFCRSLLEKKDRPKRENANYNNLEKVNVLNMSKQIISMVKLLKRTKNVMLASRNLNVPLAYINANEKIDNCTDKINFPMTSANNQSGVEKNCNISKENVSLENEKTNYINSDCSLTCRSQNKHGRVNLNVQTNTSELDCYNCHMRQGTCLCHPDPKLNNASYASVPMALANDALPDLGCTLQAILTELKIINRNTSQINVLSNNMQEFIQAEKLTNIQPLKPLHDKISDVKFDSISSLDWTYEQKKWLTPKKEDNRQKLLQNLNPIHSTPVPRDPVIMDLQDIFNNITTGSTINMTQNSSFSLSQKTNEIAFNDGKELQHRENNESLSHENRLPSFPDQVPGNQ